MKRIGFLICCLAWLLISCISNNPTQQSIQETTGTIKGRVLGENRSSGMGTVFIRGTNFISTTDSLGYYGLYNVPEGYYALYYDTLYDAPFAHAQVTAGDTAYVPDYQLTGLPMNWSYVDYIQIFDTKDSNIFYNSSYSPIFYLTVTDTISLWIQTAKENSATWWMTEYVEADLRIEINGIVVYDSIPAKGRFGPYFIVPAGIDTVRLYTNGMLMVTLVIQKERRTSNYVHITTGAATLSHTMGTFLGQYIMIDSVLYYLNYDSRDSIDWDIYFINDSTGDTCFWKNPFPDWGNTGFTGDNPSFSGDATWVHLETKYYYADQITVDMLAAGTYSIYVAFYEAANGIIRAVPRISIELGMIGSSQVEKYYEKSADTTIGKGEVWYAGKISLPEKSYSPPLAKEIGKMLYSQGLVKRK